MCMRDMWVVQWYCIFEGLVEMCEVVGFELYWKLIAKIIERLRFTFTPNGKCEFVPRDQVFPLFFIDCLLLLHKNK